MRMSLPIAALIAAGPASAQPSASPASPAAARAVVERYYAAINHGDFRSAYALWGDGGRRSGQSYAQFVRGFAQTATSTVSTRAAGDVEGAAGSAYVTVPVDVTARLKNGRRQHFQGAYTLRRVNDVDGSSAADRRWHLDQAKLRPVR